MMINVKTPLAIAVIQRHFQFAEILGENGALIIFDGCSSEYNFEFLTQNRVFKGSQDFQSLYLLDSTFQWNHNILNHQSIFMTPSTHSQKSGQQQDHDNLLLFMSMISVDSISRCMASYNDHFILKSFVFMNISPRFVKVFLYVLNFNTQLLVYKPPIRSTSVSLILKAKL